ncbi:unnamed protein product, partial [Didymodactylos carnosus]
MDFLHETTDLFQRYKLKRRRTEKNVHQFEGKSSPELNIASISMCNEGDTIFHQSQPIVKDDDFYLQFHIANAENISGNCYSKCHGITKEKRCSNFSLVESAELLDSQSIFRTKASLLATDNNAFTSTSNTKDTNKGLSEQNDIIISETVLKNDTMQNNHTTSCIDKQLSLSRANNDAFNQQANHGDPMYFQ